jgi:hypothetical protein
MGMCGLHPQSDAAKCWRGFVGGVKVGFLPEPLPNHLVPSVCKNPRLFSVVWLEK